MKSKIFKEKDIVIVEIGAVDRMYGSIANHFSLMKNYEGKIGVVESLPSNGRVEVYFRDEEDSFYWDEDCLKLYNMAREQMLEIEDSL